MSEPIGLNASNGVHTGAPIYRRRPIPEDCELSKCGGCPDCLTNTPPCAWYGCSDDGTLSIVMPDGAKGGICPKHNDVLAVILRPPPKSSPTGTIKERCRNFNDTTGASTWNGRSASLHPNRCVCQNETTPYKHYDKPPYACARCRCEGYEPHIIASESR